MFPIMQLKFLLLWGSSCRVITHIFQTAHPQFVMQAWCYTFLFSKHKLRWPLMTSAVTWPFSGSTSASFGSQRLPKNSFWSHWIGFSSTISSQPSCASWRRGILNFSSINVLTQFYTWLQYSIWTLMAPYCTFVKVYCGDRMLYLDRKPSAIYAVFWACWSIATAPVKLHLLSLKTPRQSSTSYKVVILQENCNWRQTKRKRWNQTKKEN